MMRPSPRRGGDGRPVLAVGGRVLVTGQGDATRIELTDDRNLPTGITVARDIEVEILAWRPRGSTGTRYRVRCAADGVEGWLDAGSLRALPRPPAPPPPPPPTPPPSTARAKRPARGSAASGPSRRAR